MQKIFILIFLSICFTFEVEEQLSITELKDEAQLFILNKSYVDAISNYEKIYDIQSLIFGFNHKNVANTLIVLGDLYYKLDDEINALRCFQESIRIIHYNYKVADQTFITPLEYLFEIYLNNDQIEIAGETFSNSIFSVAGRGPSFDIDVEIDELVVNQGEQITVTFYLENGIIWSSPDDNSKMFVSWGGPESTAGLVVNAVFPALSGHIFYRNI